MERNWQRLALATTAVLLLATGVLGTGATATSSQQSGEPNVTLVAHYPTDDGYVNETIVTATDVAAVGSPTQGPSGGVRVPVTLTEGGAETFATTLVEGQFTGEGVNDCRWSSSPEDPGYCLLTVVDGNVTGSFSLDSSLAQSLESGSFAEDPRFVFSARNESQAERIAAALRDGDETSTPLEGTGEPTGAGAAASEETDAATDRSDGGSTPGFTVPAVLVALLAAMVVGRVRA